MVGSVGMPLQVFLLELVFLQVFLLELVFLLEFLQVLLVGGVGYHTRNALEGYHLHLPVLQFPLLVQRGTE